MDLSIIFFKILQRNIYTNNETKSTWQLKLMKIIGIYFIGSLYLSHTFAQNHYTPFITNLNWRRV